MKKITGILNFFRNKYMITLTVFVVLILFIDHNNIFNQIERKKQLNDLLASKKFYEQQIDETRKNLVDLQNNSAALEKFARENYMLKRDNEDVFVVSQRAAEKNSTEKQ